jgi:phage terminase small subunit
MNTKDQGRHLTERQKAFVLEYLIDLNATAAYKRAGYDASGNAAESAASRLLRNVKVQAAIQSAMAERAKRTQITADEVVLRWLSIADADPSELIELRRTCCRYCHGKQFQYQRTIGEMKRDKAGWETLAEKAKAAGQEVPLFDQLGGVGYDARKAPHADCPECFGEGVVIPFPKDTRLLSERARRLYAGIKVTKDGIEVKMRDQDAALLNLAKHLGLFVNKHELTGPDCGPVTITFVKFADHEQEREPDALESCQ